MKIFPMSAASQPLLGATADERSRFLTARHLGRGRSTVRRENGSAIVITLLILAVIPVLVVGIFSVLQPERISSSSSFGSIRANALCQAAADQSIALIRGATKIAETGSNNKFWAVQPGRITVINSNGSVDMDNSVNLYSSSNVSPEDLSTVNLNQPSFSGNFPIASPNSVTITGTNPEMKVQWINVLEDSSNVASKTNTMIGRYAFWVDDELSKINVNTADGTSKSGTSSLSPGINSFGFGTPTEIDLRILKGGSNTVIVSGSSISAAQAIALRSGAHPGSALTFPFNDPSEILQATGTTPEMLSLYSDDNFNLTAYNRAPELNIFGEPKIYMFPTEYGPPAVPAATQRLGNLLLGPCTYSGTSAAMMYDTWNARYYRPPQLGAQSPPAPPNGSYYAYVTTGTNQYLIDQPVNQVYPLSGTNAVVGGNLVVRNSQLPGYAYSGVSGTTSLSGTVALPQFFGWGDGPTSSPSTGTPNSGEYPMGMRIAKYLKGFNSQGRPINWPVFPGSGANGFAGKYTDRQIDSITLQILDLMDRGVLADHVRMECLQTIMGHGFLSNELVCGTSNLPRFTEVKITFDTALNTTVINGTNFTYPSLAITIAIEGYIPKEYKSANIHDGTTNRDLTWYWGVGGNVGGFLNLQDVPIYQYGTQVVTASGTYNTIYEPAASVKNSNISATGTLLTEAGSPLGAPGLIGRPGFWADNMLRITDANDSNPDTNYAGFDLFGNDPGLPDPDPRAAAAHPYAMQTVASVAGIPRPFYGRIMGTGPRATGTNDVVMSGTLFYNPVTAWPALPMNSITGSSWTPGDYHVAKGGRAGTYYKGKPGVTSLNISGGLVIWTHNASGSGPIDVVPLDSMHGPGNPPGYTTTTGTGTVYSTSNPYGTGLSTRSSGGTASLDPIKSGTLNLNPVQDQNFRQQILDAVIPIKVMGLSVPGSKTVVMQVADPMVNKFPGDWVDTSLNSPNNTLTTKTGNPAVDQSGANVGFNANDGGDPAGYWFPEQDVRIPKSQRFSSTGWLQYIRTGMMPDLTNSNQPILLQHGTPFRLFNFAPSTHSSQKTVGGASYPDWAMLDLFTVPATFQPPYQLGDAPNPVLLLTWGGATSGRLNPNSALYSDPYTPFQFARTTPMQGILKNLVTSTAYSSNELYMRPIESDPGGASGLARAINDYVATLKDSNGNPRPLMMPGEICNVPEVARYLYTGSVSPTRNDLVRQIVGNLSTRSNTFTVWTVGQVVKKKRTSTSYDRFETGDTIVGESRMKFLVERYLDYGADGVPGNAYSSGAIPSANDGVPGTRDDVVDTKYHPAMTYPLPYKYRIISASQVNTK